MSNPKGRFPWRGFLAGVVMCLMLSITEPYVKLLLHTNGLCTDYITAGAMLFLILLILAVAVARNPVLSKIFFIIVIILGLTIGILRFLEVGERVEGIILGLTVLGFVLAFLSLGGFILRAGSKGDLITAFCMLIVASAIPAHGLLCPIFPVITGLFYYATPQNRWGELIHPHLPRWIAPQGEMAIDRFFVGLSEGEKVPWGAWAEPLLAWSLLIFAVFFVMISMMVILRKQWVEKERLIFPLTRLPLEMVREDERGVKLLFRNRLMWIGFAIAFLIFGLRGLKNYFPTVPAPSLIYGFSILRQTTTITLFLSFLILGFSYLLSLDVALSIWFFHLLVKIESGIFSILGFSLTGHGEGWCGSSVATTHQNGGAIIALVLFGLWIARRHLFDVFKKAFTGRGNVDDSQELFSYRVAVFGMMGGLIFIGCWLRAAGMPPLVIPVVIFSVFVTFLGLTRVIAQAGVGFMCCGISPPILATSSIGTSSFGPQGLAALGTIYTWGFEGRTSIMASTANGLKLSDEIGSQRNHLLLPIVTAILITLFVSSWMIINLAYHHGGINLRANWYVGMPNMAWNSIVNKILHPITPQMVGERWIFTSIGAGIMLFLMYMRTYFVRWPFHYIGFPVADIWMMNHIWFNVFLAWLLKLIILRYGGVRLYRRTLPFFLGLILGQLSVAGLFMFVDSVTNTPGHFVHVGIG